MNAMTIDPTDNNLLASLRTTSEIVKINRQTGEVMWRLGGKMNQFTFVSEHEEKPPTTRWDSMTSIGWPTATLLYFDNGNISGGGVTPNDRTYSRGVEYHWTRPTRSRPWCGNFGILRTSRPLAPVRSRDSPTAIL